MQAAKALAQGDWKRCQELISKIGIWDLLGIDKDNDAIVFRKGVELSRLQSQVITLSEKAMGILESNEKVLETRTAGMANAFQRDQGQRGGRGGRRGGANLPGLGRGQGQRRPGGQQFGGGALGG